VLHSSSPDSVNVMLPADSPGLLILGGAGLVITGGGGAQVRSWAELLGAGTPSGRL